MSKKEENNVTEKDQSSRILDLENELKTSKEVVQYHVNYINTLKPFLEDHDFDRELYERCLNVELSELDDDFLIFNIDDSEYSQFSGLLKMVKRSGDVALSTSKIKDLTSRELESLLDFLVVQNFRFLKSGNRNISFIHMKEIIRTHMLADGWSVVSNYAMNGKKGISSSQLTAQEGWSGSIAQIEWLKIFMSCHSKAPESGTWTLGLVVSDDE